MKKPEQKRLLEIEKELTQLETIYKSASDPFNLHNILKLKYEYNSILSDQVSDQLFRLRQKYFEFGDKPQKLLARQLRGLQVGRAIHLIRSKTGEMVTDPGDINERFREYYQQ